MSDAPRSYYQLESMILHLDPTSYDCRMKMADIRHLMDTACDNRAISIRQWRVLLEHISSLQSLCVAGNKTDVWTPSRRT
jgi:hypothetical protein